ncbi:MAG: diaminopimelate epimerase [Bacteroidota bacterium]|nr:diaminopimelate epimerase [Bacteroidota bacterium]MDX5506220.1 diaminopimelate epimerase [Bacteroidota bacterium]
MKQHFYKYQGTGNDFVLIDDRDKRFPQDTDLIARLCHRRFGIGADGLILLQEHPNLDFTMVYFNSDGRPSTMCGNGGRCIVRFAHDLGIIGSQTRFMAVDGEHRAKVDREDISLKMNDASMATPREEGYFLDTGSPHHVQKVEDTEEIHVFDLGRQMRNGIYGREGANINFVQTMGDHLRIRTYERGVEDETYSCGTGVTAAALVSFQEGWTSESPVILETLGGKLSVSFEREGARFTNIWLIGPAEYVYEGDIDL